MRPQRTVSLFWLWLLLFARMAYGQEAPPPPDPGVTMTTRITSGCTVSVTVTGEPDLSGSYILDETAEIPFTIADADGSNKQEWRVGIKDKTTEEAKAAITESLKKYLRAPEVAVVITRLPRIRVDISGPVTRPGPMELKPGTRLSDALARCGYKPTTDLANIRILRKAQKLGDKPQTIAVNFEARSKSVV